MVLLSLSLFAALLAAPQAQQKTLAQGTSVTHEQISPQEAAAVKEDYQKLGSVAVERKPCDGVPAGVNVVRVDVSSRIRSASFGHSTTLLVDAAAPKRYWVEYGRSTNHPAALYGPFEVH